MYVEGRGGGEAGSGEGLIGLLPFLFAFFPGSSRSSSLEAISVRTFLSINNKQLLSWALRLRPEGGSAREEEKKSLHVVGTQVGTVQGTPVQN